MAAERRNQLVLSALVVVLLVVIYRAWTGTSETVAAPHEGGRPTPTNHRAVNTVGQSAAADVHLDALQAERPRPSARGRDLFRIRPKALPPVVALPRTALNTKPAGAGPPAPTGPPPPPPITLKFIGVLDRGGGQPKLAVLADGSTAPPLYGPEGGTIAGLYRILKIGAESVDISYLDGRGRTTIRLSGG